MTIQNELKHYAYKTSSRPSALAAASAVIKTTTAIGKEYLTRNNME